MDSVTNATLDPTGGIVGNADYGSERHVTLVEHEVWEQLKYELHDTVHPVMRRANLLVRGIALAHTAGRVLQIGECRIGIRGETKACGRMDQAYPGLQAALAPDWGAGAWGVVLTGGEIRVGDEVRWEKGRRREAGRGGRRQEET